MALIILIFYFCREWDLIWTGSTTKTICFSLEFVSRLVKVLYSLVSREMTWKSKFFSIFYSSWRKLWSIVLFRWDRSIPMPFFYLVLEWISSFEFVEGMPSYWLSVRPWLCLVLLPLAILDRIKERPCLWSLVSFLHLSGVLPPSTSS